MSTAPVTLLFTDLVNSTELLARAGDEQAQRIFQAHHRLLKRCVAAHDGQEVKWLGDGLMSVFAAPADAVRCAVAVQQAARRRATGERLAIRVGLNVGEVRRDESDYFGTPVVIARRLCDHAQAGQILCSALLPGLLAGQPAFTFRECGAVELKGLSTPVSACEVLYQEDQPTALLTHTPFVGRVRELARLTAKLREARAGTGGLVMVAGEPGIGKTRTLEEFAETARTEGALVLWGRCYEGEAARPYGPFVEALAEHARSATPESLRGDLGLGAAPLARLVPAVRERLPDIPEPVALQPDEERVRLLDAVTQFLIALAARAPLVLVLDDLHWADPATVTLLRHVARFAARHRWLLVGAYRDVEVSAQQPLADALGALPRETTYEHVGLSGLDSTEVEGLLEAVADQKLPGAFVAAITAETSGNPFFIREVLLHLVEEGKIVRREGQWTANLTVEEMGIPRGVRQVIQRRLGRLSEAANRLLSAAAAFTGSFRFDVAARVASLDEGAALDAIDDALTAQLLCLTGTAETFDFTHALVRHTLYAQLSPPRQVRLHRAIADAMEAGYGAGAAEHAGEIARHYHRSATLPGAERGVAYCLMAAERAEQSAASAEVADYLRIALELSDSSDTRRPRFLARLALALVWNLDLDEAEETAIRAAQAIAAADGDAAAADFVADAADAMCLASYTPKVWSLATRGLGYCGTRRDTTWARLMVYDIERREAADPEHLGIPVDSPGRREVVARLSELPALHTYIHSNFAKMDFRSRDDVLTRAGDDPLALAFVAGEYRRVLAMLERTAAIALENGQIALAYAHLAEISRLQVTLGDLEASRSTYARAAELYERVTDVPHLRVFMSGALLYWLSATGEGWELMLVRSEAMLREDAAEVRRTKALARCAAAHAAAQLGRRDDALRWLASVIPFIDRAPGWANYYRLLLSLAVETIDALGCADHSQTLERNLRTKWLQPDFRYPMTDARLSLALLCGLQQRYDEAAEWFAKARVVLEEQGGRTLRARVDFHEARMYLRRGAPGDGERATGLLGAALEQFRAIGMTGWARRAEEMLVQLQAGADTAPAAEVVVHAAQTAQPDPRPHDVPADAIFRQEGDYWILGYQGISTRLKDAKGFHYLAHLLRHPGRELYVLDMMDGPSAGAGPSGARAYDREAPLLTRDTGLAVLDAEAKAAYRRRLDELREELAEAESFNDSGRAERARDEIEALTEQLAAAVGLGGRDRTSATAAERARMTVGKGITRTLRRIAAAHPALGEHLTMRVKTGMYCVYVVDTARPIAWEL